ncbi:ABC transporter permease [Vibrio sp. 10N.286.49.C2]|uniref:ABC transporter permease n=1 Tax=unclassified Vibrio TaxID=2614977 RepID=UPI000C863910|nr:MULTISPECIES: ABC transporter permease [unclassified Vibrio]PMH40066.1 ABC transporter permease [Vibrio sp. 10N.286.49.C2]PMH52159.1 ABC transporter permease [Vibrio sp. 10N.286.49.B1]PMH78993.1 ABC transporter permease [Vibrio sp. 10N.286.48.B7]
MSITETTMEAFSLLFSLDRELWKIVAVSFSVSVSAVSLVVLPAILCSYLLAYTNFPGKWMLLSLVNTLQAIPTVVIGLLLYMMLSRSGPLGDWQMLFTQKAMIIGQILICFPVLVSMMHGALQSTDRRAMETSITLGVSRTRTLMTLIWESRFPLLAAVVAGFSRIVTEVGCSMMVGGNIMGLTRNIPTAIAMESHKGAFAQGVALGIVLLLLALILNFVLSSMRGKGVLRTH